MKYLLLLILFSGSVLATDLSEQYKKEIMATEIAFANKAKVDGLKKAFLFYAADEAVLKRGKRLIKGKPDIAKYFDENPKVYEKFTWLPDFIEVSDSGDLGYTYGAYELAFHDKDDKLVEAGGIFHTVWKRQADGKWRYVWD